MRIKAQLAYNFYGFLTKDLNVTSVLKGTSRDVDVPGAIRVCSEKHES